MQYVFFFFHFKDLNNRLEAFCFIPYSAGFYGETDIDQAKVDMMVDTIEELVVAFEQNFMRILTCKDEKEKVIFPFQSPSTIEPILTYTILN